MPVYSYNTIREPAEGYFKDSGSRFLAFAFPVISEAEVKNQLQALRKKYFDARHQGYAYILGPDQKTWRAFDDGEPNHSTGDPILGQIKSRKLTNVLVVVVRYFGGTKLGVSGLIAAYRAAADDALSHAVIVARDVITTLNLEFDFSATPSVMKLIKDYQVTILEQAFTDKALMKLEVKLKVEEQVKERVALLKAMGSPIEISPGLERH
ncbi:MAG: YigZ family protein [Cyclobacteriaceae bacterium]|nr:YigZ family protein [Cyclobacteriaceae bacterium]